MCVRTFKIPLKYQIAEDFSSCAKLIVCLIISHRTSSTMLLHYVLVSFKQLRDFRAVDQRQARAKTVELVFILDVILNHFDTDV